MGWKYRGQSRQVLKSFATDTVPKYAERRIRSAAVFALRTAMFLSPYRTGQFVASWRVSNGEKDNSYAYEGQRSDKSSASSEALMDSLSAIESFKIGDTLVLSNSVPHAGFVEYGSPTTPARYITKRVKLAVRMLYGGVK